MNQPFTLQPLLDLTNSRLDRATRELGKLIANEQEGARKLEILQNYRNEYQTRFQDAMRDGIGVEALRNYSAFMARIDEAIEIQRANLHQSQRNTAAGKEAWMTHRNKLKAFDTLHDRHLAKERRKDVRDEQRASDEHSANRHRNREGAEDG